MARPTHRHLSADSASHVDRFIAFLGLHVRPEQHQAATVLIQPQREHF